MKLKLTMIIFLSMILSGLSAQSVRNISGIVKDASDGSPLIGATVIVKGTAQGAITNREGKFNYQLKRKDIENVVLVFSYVGYQSQEVQVKDKSFFEILLEEDVNALEEVVITSSYGTKKLKQEVVGSITSVNTKDIITEQSAMSFDELLEGQAAGVYIESGSGVGNPVNIHVRGQGSLTPLNNNNVGSSTQPLIIVDGVILAEEINLDGNNFFDGGGGMLSENLLNPLAKIGIKDIESFNILKDAAAVSLYGADGANGVIIITTKGGHKGPMKYNFTAQGGVTTDFNRIEYMDGQQYQELRNAYYMNNGQPENVKEWNGVSTDWYDLLNRTGSFQNYDLSASGGGDLFKYRASIGYRNIQEPQIMNNYSKYNAGLSLNFSGKKLSASLKLTPGYTIKNTPNTFYTYAVPPTIAPYDDEGNYTPFDTYGNPLAVAHQNRNLTETKAAISSLSFNYKLNEYFNVSSLFGLDLSNKDQDTWYSGLNQTGIDNNGNLGNRMLRDRDTRRWNWNAKASYQQSFQEKHNMDALAGVETRQSVVDFGYHRAENFPNPGIIQDIDLAEIHDIENDRSESSGRSLFSQFNYDFRKKYFFLANFRIDQSSAFGNDNNTSFNGGVGASWVISKERFFAGVKWIEFLRLRTSYGTSGNSRIGSYRALGLYSFDDIGFDGYNRGNTAFPYTAPNPFLGWEKNYKFNLGLDITTNSRISTSVEFFNDNIRDMIVSRSVIPETGFSNVQINGADMYNRGIEFSIRSQVISNSKFKWTSQFNFSKVVNKITHMEGLGSDYSAAENARAQRVGYPTSVIWGYDFVGIDPATGKELYRVEGNIVDAVTLKDVYNENRFWQPIGNSQPDFFGGFNNRFKIGKGFEVAVIMSYSYGADRLVQKEFLDNYRVISFRNLTVNAYENSWRKPGDIALYPVVANNPLVSNTTKYLYNTSNIKLKSVNISYNFDIRNKNNFIDRMRIYANGSNLYSWFLDKAEEGQNGIAQLQNIYPEMRTFSIGLNLSF